MDDIWNSKFWEGPRRRAQIAVNPVTGDPVNPNHYKKEPLVVDVIEGWDLNFNLGCVLKYIARYKEKGGLTDLEKARWYLEREISRLLKGVER